MQFKPHAYQQYAIDRIISDEAVGLFLDMGLGKTVITLSAIAQLRYERFTVGRVLVIAPKKVAEATWQNEARRWNHTNRLVINTILGTVKQREAALQASGDVWIINRENVKWLVEYCEAHKKMWPFDMVVLDESSSFKNGQSQRFKALKKVRPHIRKIVELTGTPSPNGLEDLWAQAYLLDSGKRLGRTITSFREAYFTPDYARPGQMYRTYTPQPFADQLVQKRLSDICISMRAEDYLDLPDMMTDVIPVVLDAAAQKVYAKMEKEMLLDIADTEITAGSAAVLTGKLLQLCNGAIYDDEKEWHELHTAKLEALMETLEQINDHTIVFYSYKHDLERITSDFDDFDVNYRVYKGPQDEIDWNDGKIDVLLAHPASCGYGLNLQRGGNHIVWFGLTWSLEQYQQANKRLHRQGQTKPVIIHHLVVQGGVDEDVLKALQGKADTQTAIMEALKARIKNV